jgi:hypothetical protein
MFVFVASSTPEAAKISDFDAGSWIPTLSGLRYACFVPPFFMVYATIKKVPINLDRNDPNVNPNSGLKANFSRSGQTCSMLLP